MSTSDVSICNGAAVLLGSSSLLTALADDTKIARTFNAVYEDVRRSELRAHRWKFSITRASLAALSTTPASDYARQFELPNDFLRLIEGGDIFDVPDLSDMRMPNALYSIEAGSVKDVILTNLAAPLKIRYIADITDPSRFDPCFVRAFSAKLADQCCESITQSDSKKQLARQNYEDALKDATRAGALEAASQSIADSEWVMCRTQ